LKEKINDNRTKENVLKFIFEIMIVNEDCKDKEQKIKSADT